ncbi:hypothetical protein COOONC_25580 [Cooperia oncophora]
MSKKKSKNQKKKFFAHPKNRNIVFKKKKGPCLLFGEREKGQIKSRFFACAVHRSDTSACPFKAIVDDDFNIVREEAGPSNCRNDETTKCKSEGVRYGCIPKKLKAIPKSSVLVFCHECIDVFETKHKCPSEVVSRAQLRCPSRLLAAKESQSGEAQFFFSNESIEVLQGAVERSGVDGVLCLGTPRLFEVLRKKKDSNRHLFLLDYDERYARFFPARQFAQYSMLVDHFFDKKASKKLDAFFAECSQVLLICDPPFGVFLEPLMQTVESLQQRYKKARYVQFLLK